MSTQLDLGSTIFLLFFFLTKLPFTLLYTFHPIKKCISSGTDKSKKKKNQSFFARERQVDEGRSGEGAHGRMGEGVIGGFGRIRVRGDGNMG